MQSLNKKGDLTVNNLVGLIIAAASMIVLASLLFQLINPTFDIKKETVKGYHSQILNAFDEVEETGGAELSLFVNPNSKNTYFLVYFGEKKLYENVLFKSWNLSSSFYLDNRVDLGVICMRKVTFPQCLFHNLNVVGKP